MKKLYRSHSNRLIGGVCGGLGDYFGADPVLVRLVFIMLCFLGGIGLVIYLTALVIVPVDQKPASTSGEGRGSARGRFWWGLILVLLGVFMLGGAVPFMRWNWWPGTHFHPSEGIPVALILLGIYLLYTFGRQPSDDQPGAERRVYRSRTDRKIGGVCGGIAEYLNLDPTLIRVAWVLAIVFYGAGLLLYLILLVVIPEAPAETLPESTGDSG